MERENRKEGRPRPRGPKPSGNFEHSVGPNTGAPVGDQNERIEPGRVDAVRYGKRLPGDGLERGKLEQGVRIAVDDPLDGPVAERTHAVEEHNRVQAWRHGETGLESRRIALDRV